MSTPRSIVVATHGHCFDGLCSAALFTRLFRHLHPGEALDFRYLAMGYGPGQNGVPEELLTGDDNVILDYRFSGSPRLTWYFDHHVSAFPLPTDRGTFETRTHEGQARGQITFFHDGGYGSCTKLIADVGAARFDLDPEPLAPLIHWADMIDAARFPSPEMPVLRREPVLQLMAVVESAGDAAFATRMVPRLLDTPIEDLARLPEVQTAYAPLAAGQDAFVARVKDRAVRVGAGGPVVLVDLTDQLLEVAGKFVTYALYPESAYSVLVTRSASKIKISIGYNPWSKQERKHDIAAICERYGGGGHPVVGAISLPADQLARAQEIAATVVEELSR
jgi:hypothetical protein